MKISKLLIGLACGAMLCGLASASGYLPSDQVDAPPPGTTMTPTDPPSSPETYQPIDDYPPVYPPRIKYGKRDTNGGVYPPNPGPPPDPEYSTGVKTVDGNGKTVLRTNFLTNGSYRETRFYDCTSCHPGLKVWVTWLRNPGPPPTETFYKSGTW